VAFYGLGLNSGIILQAIGFGTPPTAGALGVYQTLQNICVGNLIISVAGLIPGYWVSFLLIDSWGRKPIQFMGFIVLTALFVIMGRPWLEYHSFNSAHVSLCYFQALHTTG
jgi:MFS transporter, PHS family, inorganic phosphate transporter